MATSDIKKAPLYVDSTNNLVGVGTSSPNRKLTVHDSVGTVADFTSTGTVGGGFSLGDANSTANYNRIRGVGNDMQFVTNNSEAMRIDSSGQVLIGTTVDHSANLTVDDTGGAKVVLSGRGNSGSDVNKIEFRDRHTASYTEGQLGSYIYGHRDGVGVGHYLTFGTTDVDADATERMRIDSTGRLLVGQTSANYNAEGAYLSPDGYITGCADEASSTDNAVAFLNRKTSDGDIIRLYKDGSRIGNIGVDNSDNLYISGNSTHAGLQFANVEIIPHKNGAYVDDDISLGNINYGFKDIRLTGGVYLGGTGAANYLDDYEEGTFTPFYEPASGSFSSITYDTITNGYYTKIGNRVFFEGRIRTDALTVGTASGALYLNGLPFAANIQAGAISVGYTATWAGNSARMGYFSGSTRVYLVDTPTSTGNTGLLNVTDMATGANSNYIYFSGHYRTSA